MFLPIHQWSWVLAAKITSPTNLKCLLPCPMQTQMQQRPFLQARNENPLVPCLSFAKSVFGVASEFWVIRV